jgi:16S rRNA (uracil1498-N3)-methyltransferase
MRVPRIYQNIPLTPSSRITLDETAHRHIITVLRLEINDKIILFNGDGNEYPSVITHHNRHTVEVKILDSIIKDFDSSLHLHLGQVITKGEKMDYLLQKATELGISEITPLFSARGEVRLKGEREEKKKEHWHKVLSSACEQCGRNKLPKLNSPLKLPEWVHEVKETTKIMLDHRSEKSFKESTFSKNIALLIGPEGGLTFEEKIYAERFGFSGVYLGPRILRSETAGVAAITCLQLLEGDLERRPPSPEHTENSQ